VVAQTIKVMSDLFFGKKAATVTQVSNLFNMRNRYFQPEDERQKRYCGNAMYIHVPRAYFENGFQKATRGEIAQFLKVEFDKVSEESVRRQMDLVIDCLRHGYTYPNLDAMKPLIGSNNQSKLDVYGVDFGAGELLRVIPQDIGEGILLFPGKDGGMEIYLRHSLKPKLTSQLRNKEWQKKLYAI